MQEAVKNTEFIIPFVFYDGTNIPGGSCKVKKGDHTWVFLDRSRKAGADLGVGGSERANSRREWARVGVDDLMLVRGEVIIPHVGYLWLSCDRRTVVNTAITALRILLLYSQSNLGTLLNTVVQLFGVSLTLVKLTILFA